MGSRVNTLAVVSVLLLAAIGVWIVAPTEGAASVMCPPTKIDDLFPEETTTTAAPETTTTTVPETTTTTAPPTTTTAPETTTSTVADTTTTTEAPPTTATDEEEASSPATEGDTTTTAPETTTTTVPETTTTTAPPTTTTRPETTTTTQPTTTTTTTEPPCDTPFVYPLVFPILGAGDIGSPFGAPRDGGRRLHMGNDLFAPHLQPVVAAADGVVSRIAGDTGISGYRVHIRHDDGWSTLYIHLNNDTAGTDDGNGIGIRPDLEEGDRVAAGEVIGWVGDSGNAETTPHHLHFELRDPSGDSVDPEPSLRAAKRLGDPFTGPFSDLPVEGEEVPALVKLLSRGVAVWCDDPTLACPHDPLRSDRLDRWMAAFGSAQDVDCDGECPGVTEADIARRVAWQRLHDGYQTRADGLDSEAPDAGGEATTPEPPASPDDLTVEEAHRVLGGVRRCLAMPNEDRYLTSAEAAETFMLYLGWTGNDYCPTSSVNR